MLSLRGPCRLCDGRRSMRSMPKIVGVLLVMTFAAIPSYLRLRQSGTSATTSIELLLATLIVVIAACLIAGLRGRVDRRAGHLDFTRPPGKRKVPGASADLSTPS